MRGAAPRLILKKGNFMAKIINNDTTETTTENKQPELEVRTFTLSNGMKVEMTEPDTDKILLARELANKKPGHSYLFLIAECTKFDGKKLTAFDITKFRGRDYLLLEGNISELAGEKN